MSEQTETKEQLPPTKHTPKKQGSGSSGAFLAMVIALAAGGGSYYVWQQHLVAEQDRKALAQSVEQLLAVVQDNDRAQQQRIEQLREHRHENIEQRLAALEQSIPDLSQQLSVQQRDWSLAEVDYLLRLAERRLQLSKDIPTAIAALEQAREQLITRTGGNFSAVVPQIEQHVDTLAQLEQHSTNQITSRLSALIAALDALPFAIQAEQEQLHDEAPVRPATGADFSERASYWGRIIWHDIKSLVTIRRSDEITPPLMNAEQRYLLQAQLRLKLETARLGAMGRNQPLYQASLKEASGWLSRYYDSNDPGVVEAYASLNELAALSVDPELPSLGDLRQQLHATRRPAPVPAPVQMPHQEPVPPTEPSPSPWGTPADTLEETPPHPGNTAPQPFTWGPPTAPLEESGEGAVVEQQP